MKNNSNKNIKLIEDVCTSMFKIIHKNKIIKNNKNK